MLNVVVTPKSVESLRSVGVTRGAGVTKGAGVMRGVGVMRGIDQLQQDAVTEFGTIGGKGCFGV